MQPNNTIFYLFLLNAIHSKNNTTVNYTIFYYCLFYYSCYELHILIESGTSTNPCSDIYAGVQAFSEPEAQAIANFTTRINDDMGLAAYLSLHSYGQYWLYSWGYTRKLPQDHHWLVN